MKRVTLVLIGLIAIITYLATSRPKLEDKIVQAKKVSIKKQSLKKIYD